MSSLATQPTLSRFENAARARDLLRLSVAFADAVIARHKRRKKRVRRITIDLDPMDDPTHANPLLSTLASLAQHAPRKPRWHALDLMAKTI